MFGVGMVSAFNSKRILIHQLIVSDPTYYEAWDLLVALVF